MAADSDVLSEIEVLKSIYLEELSVNENSPGYLDVSLVLHPSTAQDSLSQFVRLTLTLSLDSEYPSSLPAISIHHPRGLSDDKLLSLQQCLQTEAQSCLGGPALYQLIEKAKEILTESNIPHGNCVICLYDFKEEDVFTKTGCYHYFHSYCLGRYVAHSESEIREREKELEQDKTRERGAGQELTVVCPVCREPLTYDLEVLLASPAPCFPIVEDTVAGAEFRKNWAKLQTVLERQRKKGGIIDPEAESNRFLIHINENSPEPGTIGPALDTPPCQAVPPSLPADQLSASCSLLGSSQSQRRGGPGRRRRVQLKQSRRGERQVQQGKPGDIAEQLNKVTLSSGRSAGFRGHAAAMDEGTLEAKELGSGVHAEDKVQPTLSHDSDGDTYQDTCLSTATIPRQAQSTDQSSVAGNHLDSGVSERARGHKWDRGRRKGQLQERVFKRPDQWEASRERGQRGRGGVNPHHRGRAAGRGARRSFSHSGAEHMEGCDGSAFRRNEMYVHVSSHDKPAP